MVRHETRDVYIAEDQTEFETYQEARDHNRREAVIRHVINAENGPKNLEDREIAAWVVKHWILLRETLDKADE